MRKGKVAGRAPVVIEQEAGEYRWCACGESKNQPFCDGSHTTVGFSPVKYTLTEKKKVALCTCKQTGNPPFCDGTHKTLPAA